LVFLRTKPLSGRPTIPRALRDRVSVRTARDGTMRAPLLAEAAIFVPALAGLGRVSLEAAAAGCAIAAPPGTQPPPELETAELARGRCLVVIPGEEVKTDDQGEVIGLFLREEIPRGLSFDETISAIRDQGGLVYLPHPFDRLHSIPDPATLHRHLADIDLFEVYNARLLFEAYNDEALRFARKYNLTMGAGSDAHVLQGVGTGAVRMRRCE